jgi:Secretion system C-terminal sorting domain
MKHRYALLIAASFVRSLVALAQPPAMAWEAFFNGSLPGTDETSALIIAPDNSIYVTGSSTNLAPQGTITTIRYSAAGSQLWADHVYGPSQETQNKGSDMAMDPWGNVFVCGNFSASSGDLGVIKYNSSGRLWRENYEQYPMADVLDEALGIAVDAQGNAYVAGYITSTAGMGLDSYTLKVDSAGTELWHDAFSLSSSDDVARDVAISPAGNIYVGGDWWNVGGAGGIDISTVRFAADGTRLWDEGYEVAGWTDELSRIAATAADGVIACGSATTTTPDAVVVARDASGAELWHVTYAGSGNVDDDAVDVHELSDGKVAAVIHSRELVSGSLRHSITTLLIDAGTVLWTMHYEGTSGLGAWPTAMTIDANNNIFISGYMVAPGNTTTDAVVLKYTPSGTLEWSIPYDGGSSMDDRFNAIGVNPYGDVVVSGTSHTSTTDSRYVTVQYGNAVGVNDPFVGNESVNVFPNPASTRLNINAPQHHGPCEVFNALGERVLVTSTPRSIDVSAWNEGLYFLRTDNGSRTTTSRFTVQH